MAGKMGVSARNPPRQDTRYMTLCHAPPLRLAPGKTVSCERRTILNDGPTNARDFRTNIEAKSIHFLPNTNSIRKHPSEGMHFDVTDDIA